jgi:hypothetical protein
MPRIDDRLLDSVIYFYASEKSANAGERLGGSGFVVGIPSNTYPGKLYIYAITNAHVIEEGFTTLRFNNTEGQFVIVQTKVTDWEYHHDEGVDLAACSLTIPSNIYIFPINIEKWFLTPSAIDEFKIGIGDETFTVGRFINHEGEQKNLPSVRFGNISMMPYEPVAYKGRTHEAFLIEARSIPGYSGSPVFVHLLPFTPRPTDATYQHEKLIEKMLASYHVWLLGIDCGVLPPRRADNPQYTTSMMVVLPIWKLKELLFLPRFIEQRKQCDDLLAKETN